MAAGWRRSIPLTLLLVTGCAKPEAEAPEASAPPPVVETARVMAVPARRTLTVLGTATTDEDRVALVTSPVAGKVVRLLASEGDEIGRNQALLEIESQPFAQAELDYLKALSEWRYQRGQERRDEALLKQGALAGDELRQTRHAVTKAKADLSAAEAQLRIFHGTSADIRRLQATGRIRGTLPVVSPISGHVLERSVRLGEAVPPEKALLTVVDHSRLWVLAKVPEADVPKVRRIESVVLHFAAVPHRPYVGHVIHLHDRIDPATRTLELKLWLRNPDHLLRPEMLATVDLGVRGETAGVAIPKAALQVSASGDVVVAASGRDFAVRPVTVLEPLDGERLRVTGLTLGETVVTTGSQALMAQLVPPSGDDE